MHEHYPCACRGASRRAGIRARSMVDSPPNPGDPWSYDQNTSDAASLSSSSLPMSKDKQPPFLADTGLAPSPERLAALYSFTRAQRDANPDGYGANVKWWGDAIAGSLAAGYLGDTLVLHPAALPDKFANGSQRPRGLGGVIVSAFLKLVSTAPLPELSCHAIAHTRTLSCPPPSSLSRSTSRRSLRSTPRPRLSPASLAACSAPAGRCWAASPLSPEKPPRRRSGRPPSVLATSFICRVCAQPRRPGSRTSRTTRPSTTRTACSRALPSCARSRTSRPPRSRRRTWTSCSAGSSATPAASSLTATYVPAFLRLMADCQDFGCGRGRHRGRPWRRRRLGRA